MIVLSVLVAWYAEHRSVMAAAFGVAILGWLLLLISSPLQPLWLYGLEMAGFIVWLWTNRKLSTPCAIRICASLSLLAVSLLLALHELRHALSPGIPPIIAQRFCVIGDSLSAGVRTNEVSWPAVLAKRHDVQVASFARPGARLQDALAQADHLTPSDTLVLLEIGGNDLLGGTPLREFERDMTRLLDAVSKPGRVMLMLELPLPPLCNLYGAAQRHIADKFGVVLIPKRHLVAVLCGQAATIDGLHLSQSGHDHMAKMVWRFVGPSLSTANSKPRLTGGQ